MDWQGFTSALFLVISAYFLGQANGLRKFNKHMKELRDYHNKIQEADLIVVKLANDTIECLQAKIVFLEEAMLRKGMDIPK